MLEEPASAMPTEPAPPEPPPLEPPPMEPPAPETPPTDTARMEPPPPGAPPPPIDVTPETATGDDIDTPTMAELYASQGHFDKAILVYRNLLSRNPDETSYRERIEELEMLMKATSEPSPTPRMGRTGGADPQTQQTIQLLEGWLDGIRRSRRA